MVAQITDGTAFDKRGRPFRRRNYLPGILLFVTLAVVTMLVWVLALSQPVDVHEATVCNAPPPAADPTAPAAQLGEQVTRADMTGLSGPSAPSGRLALRQRDSANTVVL